MPTRRTAPPAEPTGRRRGRPPGASDSRARIVAAARDLFARSGYQGTTIRSVAAAAGVDPALVMQQFGSKDGLFATVVELPFDPAAVLPALLAGDRDTIGLRFGQVVLGVIDTPGPREPIIAMIRGSATHPLAAQAVRERLTRDLFGPLVAALDVDDAEVRAGLVGAQVVGLVMARHVVSIEPLATRPSDELARLLAPWFQRLLTQPLE